MSEIRGILLDLDGTLYDYERCNEYAKSGLFENLSREFGISKDEAAKAYSDARSAVKKLLGDTASSHSRLLYIQRTLETFGADDYISKTVFYHEFFWQKFFERMKLFDGVIEFLEYAAKNNIKICIVTDMVADIQMKKIAKLGIEKYISCLVTSEEAGCEKPSMPIFLLALEKLKMPKEAVIMIGDDEKDISGQRLWVSTLSKQTSRYSKMERLLNY